MNFYTTVVKGKLTKLGKDYYLILDDGTEINAKLSKKLQETIESKEYETDLSKSYLYEGQLKTLRFAPYLIMDKVVGIHTEDVKESTFEFTARVFKVFKNCTEKYNTEYNFLLVSVGNKAGRFPMKLSFKELDNYDLVSKTAKFKCHREGYFIVIDSMEVV